MRVTAAGTRFAPRASDSSTALVKSRYEVSLSTATTFFGRRGLTLDEAGSASRNSSNVSSGQLSPLSPLSPVKSPTRSRLKASTLQLEAEAGWPTLSESRERGSSLSRMVAEDFRSNRSFLEASDAQKSRNLGIERPREVEVTSTTLPSNGKRPSTSGQLPKLAAAGMLQLSMSSRDSIGSSMSTQSGTTHSLSSLSPSSSPLHQAAISPKAFGLKRMASRPWLSNGFGQKVLEELTLPQSPTKSLKRLAEGQKIFDLYYWEDVLQEEGNQIFSITFKCQCSYFSFYNVTATRGWRKSCRLQAQRSTERCRVPLCAQDSIERVSTKTRARGGLGSNTAPNAKL